MFATESLVIENIDIAFKLLNSFLRFCDAEFGVGKLGFFGAEQCDGCAVVF